MISPKRPTKYQVLPGKDGLKQLIENGKIKKIKSRGGKTEYKVLQPFPHYPAGLTWHRYVFVFDPFTSQPEYNPGFRNRIRLF